MSDIEVKTLRFVCQPKSTAPVEERTLYIRYNGYEAGVPLGKDQGIWFDGDTRGKKIDNHVLGKNITNSLKAYVFFLRFALEQRKSFDEQRPLKLADFDNVKCWKDDKLGARKTKFSELCKSPLITKKDSGYAFRKDIEVSVEVTWGVH